MFIFVFPIRYSLPSYGHLKLAWQPFFGTFPVLNLQCIVGNIFPLFPTHSHVSIYNPEFNFLEFQYAFYLPSYGHLKSVSQPNLGQFPVFSQQCIVGNIFTQFPNQSCFSICSLEFNTSFGIAIHLFLAE